MKPLRYSAIDTAYSCMYLYKLKYLDGLEFPGSYDLEFGTAIHRAIQGHHDGEDAQRIFKIYWTSVKDMPLKRYRFDWDYLSEAGEVMLGKWLKYHAKNYKAVSVEKELSCQIGKFKFTGTPDFVGEYMGLKSIVDYKAFSKEISVERVLSNEQMYIYAEMAKQTLGYEVEQIAYVGFLKPDKRIQSNRRLLLTPTKLASMLVNVEAMATELEGRTVFPKNRQKCEGCEAFSICYEQGATNE